jgi:hypothetical protein
LPNGRTQRSLRRDSSMIRSPWCSSWAWCKRNWYNLIFLPFRRIWEEKIQRKFPDDVSGPEKPRRSNWDKGGQVNVTDRYWTGFLDNCRGDNQLRSAILVRTFHFILKTASLHPRILEPDQKISAGFNGKFVL